MGISIAEIPDPWFRHYLRRPGKPPSWNQQLTSVSPGDSGPLPPADRRSWASRQQTAGTYRRHSGSAAAPSGLSGGVGARNLGLTPQALRCRPFGAGFVGRHTFTWGSRQALRCRPFGAGPWAAVAHAGLLLPFGARSVSDRGLLRRNHASPAPKGQNRKAWGVSPRFPGVPTIRKPRRGDSRPSPQSDWSALARCPVPNQPGMGRPRLVLHELAPVLHEPAAVLREPALVLHEPALVLHELAPVLREPGRVRGESSSVLHGPARVLHDRGLSSP